MERHLISWRQSGLSQRRYCDQAGLGYYGFRYWYDKLTSEDAPQSAFSEIRLPAPAGSSQIEIEYPGGTRLRLHGYFPPEYIKSLI